MKRERIKSASVYVVAYPQGISGFRKPDVPALVSGWTKRTDLLPDWSGYLGPLEALRWSLDNGRLPEFRPRTSLDQACTWIQEAPRERRIAFLGGE